MNYWKITNTSNQNAKLVVSLNSNQSKGVILKPGDFCLSNSKQTPVMDAQVRRKLITVEKDFDNSVFDLKLGEVYSTEFLKKLLNEEEEDRMKQARINAENYMNNPE